MTTSDGNDRQLIDYEEPVEAAGHRFFVDREQPVAAIVAPDGAVTFATWPDAPLPPGTTTQWVFAHDSVVWVVYREDEAVGRPEETTVVRITADGTTTALDLGGLHAIGFGESSAWGTPQALAPFEDEDEGAGGLEADDEIDAEVNGVGPDPLSEFGLSRDSPVTPWAGEVIDERDDDDGFDLDDLELPADGEPARYAWSAFPIGFDDDIEIPRLAEPAPPEQTGPVAIRRFDLDGKSTTLIVDRHVDEVVEHSTSLVIVYSPTGPVGTLDDNGGSISYDYPRRVVVIDTSLGIPEAVSVDSHPSTSSDPEADDDRESLYESSEFDVTAVDGARWSVRRQSPAVIEAAVEKVKDSLLALDEPLVSSDGRDDGFYLAQAPYWDVEVEVTGQWPETVAAAFFRYRPHPDARFHVAVEVFDAVGRPASWRYLSIYLEENLMTKRLGEFEVRTDGAFEVSIG